MHRVINHMGIQRLRNAYVFQHSEIFHYLESEESWENY
jgi:hypothetical protein